MQENNESNAPETINDENVLLNSEPLTEEQKRAIEYAQLLASKGKNKTKKVYGATFRKTRKKKNRAQKKSKQNNRK